jgi:hypothetical protein
MCSARAVFGTKSKVDSAIASSVNPMVGGAVAVRRASTLATASTAPAAPNVCPMKLLMLLVGTFGARSPNTARMTFFSMASLAGVPVPCPLT